MTWERADNRLRPPPWAPHVAGRFYTNFCETLTATTAMAAATMYAIPFFVPTLTTYTWLGIETTVAAANNVRLGIYRDAGGVPGALVLDAGIVSVATPTGLKFATISQQLTPGWYWLAAIFEGTPTCRTTSQSSAYRMLGHTAGTDTAAHVGWSVAQAYGALPDPFTGGGALMTIAAIRILMSP